jgi:hypothetical protein
MTAETFHTATLHKVTTIPAAPNKAGVLHGERVRLLTPDNSTSWEDHPFYPDKNVVPSRRTTIDFAGSLPFELTGVMDTIDILAMRPEIKAGQELQPSWGPSPRLAQDAQTAPRSAGHCFKPPDAIGSMVVDGIGPLNKRQFCRFYYCYNTNYFVNHLIYNIISTN